MSSAKLPILSFLQSSILGRRRILLLVAPCHLKHGANLPAVSLRCAYQHLRISPLGRTVAKRYMHIGSYGEARATDADDTGDGRRTEGASLARTSEETEEALNLLSELERDKPGDGAAESSRKKEPRSFKGDTYDADAQRFIAIVKKGLRKVVRYESIVVKYDPSDKKKAEIALESAKLAELKAKSRKTEAKAEVRKQLGEEMEPWRKHRLAMKEKFPEGWNPRKKLSPDAMEGIRALHEQFPEHYSLQVLSKTFGISPEAARRILKSKWRRQAANTEELADRWTERGTRIWTQMAAGGMAPPRKWAKMGIKRDMLQIGQRDAQEGNRRLEALGAPERGWNGPPHPGRRPQGREPAPSQDTVDGDEDEPDMSLRRFSNML